MTLQDSSSLKVGLSLKTEQRFEAESFLIEEKKALSQHLIIALFHTNFTNDHNICIKCFVGGYSL